MKSLRLDNLHGADSVVVSPDAGTAASVVSRVIGLVRGVAIAWLIPSEFGLIGVSLLMVNVFMPVSAAGLYESVIRYAPLHEKAGTLRPFAVDRTCVALLVALCAAGLGWTAILPVFAAALVVAVATGKIFTTDERRRLLSNLKFLTDR